MLLLGWVLGCREEPPPGSFDLAVAPSSLLEAVQRATWDGPSGDAELWAVPASDFRAADPSPGQAGFVPGAWQLVSRREGVDGADGLPIALLPAGSWLVRVVVEGEGGGRGSSVAPVEIPASDLQDGRVSGVDPDRSAVAGGLLVAHQYAVNSNPGAGRPVIFDAEGRVVWWMPADPDGRRAIRVVPTRDGAAVWVLWDGRGPDDVIDRVALDGESIVRTVARDATHDLTENPDGTVSYLAYTYAPPGAMADFPDWRVAADAIHTTEPGTTDPDAFTLGWDFFDDYPAAPVAACSHVFPNNFVPGAVEWTHGNSLLADPDGDGWWMLARHLDALLHVGADGARRWQLGGGAEATLRPASPGDAFRHGHTSHAWREDDGLHLLMFDNRTHDPDPVSRVLEWRIDPDAGTYEAVWEVTLDDRYVGFLGDARRLPGGTTLVDWTAYAELTEHAPDGEVVWRMSRSEPLGRVVWVPRLTP